MTDLKPTIASDLAARYKKLAGVVHELAAPLSDEKFWAKPFTFGNSFGHLVLHLTGNLNYYIGAQIAGTHYVRDRDREFTEADRPAKADVLRNFDRAIQLVVDTIREQSPENWSAAYSAERSKEENRFAIVLSCAAHVDHHIGQIIYLSRELTGRAA